MHGWSLVEAPSVDQYSVSHDQSSNRNISIVKDLGNCTNIQYPQPASQLQQNAIEEAVVCTKKSRQAGDQSLRLMRSLASSFAIVPMVSSLRARVPLFQLEKQISRNQLSIGL